MNRWGCAVAFAAGCASSGTSSEIYGPPEEVLSVHWRLQLTPTPIVEYMPQEFAAATSDGQRLFLGSRGGQFFAFRTDDGEILWHQPIEGGVSSQPLLEPAIGTVYVGGNDGAMYAFDAATGKERWRYRTKGPIEGVPALAEGLLCFTNGENRIYALDAATGAWRWQYDRDAPESFTIRGFSSPLLYGGRAYVGFADGYLVALSAKTGEVVWAHSLAAGATRFVDVDSTPVIAEGALYASSYSGGVYALSPADGAVRWRYEVEGAGTVQAAGEEICFSAVKAGLHCLDRKGRLLWRQSLAKQGVLSTPVLVGPRLLLVSAAAGGTYVVDRPSGRLMQYFDPGQGVSAPVASDGRQVYLLSNAGFLYAFTVRL